MPDPFTIAALVTAGYNALRGGQAQGQANELDARAVELAERDYASREPLRQGFTQGVLRDLPAAPDLSAAFADPSNPFSQVGSGRLPQVGSGFSDTEFTGVPGYVGSGFQPAGLPPDAAGPYERDPATGEYPTTRTSNGVREVENQPPGPATPPPGPNEPPVTRDSNGVRETDAGTLPPPGGVFDPSLIPYEGSPMPSGFDLSAVPTVPTAPAPAPAIAPPAPAMDLGSVPTVPTTRTRTVDSSIVRQPTTTRTRDALDLLDSTLRR